MFLSRRSIVAGVLLAAALVLISPAAMTATAEASTLPATRTIDGPFVIRGFVNSTFGNVVPDTAALSNDPATALKICQLAGYSRVAGQQCHSSQYNRCGYASCGDNGIARWNGSSFVTQNACSAGNNWLAVVTCADPIQTATPTPTPTPTAQCADGIDNDGDGATDLNDFSCSGPTDNDETNPKAQCQDGIDNDHDGLVDLADPGCSSRQDNDETNATTPAQCSDGIDNDGDGATDLNDFSCSGPTDNDETNPKAACQDGIDNDHDGLVDLTDPGCSSPQDNDESNTASQCADGIDNDNDGATDLNDFSCSGPTDNDETNPKAQCQDGDDNDSDNRTDLDDPGCSSKQDNDETNSSNKNAGLSITKTDNHDITRPGHSLTYTITVKNTGNVDLHDVTVEDKVPAILIITSVSNGGSHDGHTVTWRNLTVEAGATKTLTVTTNVKADAANGSIIRNGAKVCSADYNICESTSGDTTRVERLPQVAAIHTVPVQRVPVTARTGAGSLMVSLLSLIGGSGGFTYLVRRGR